MRVKKSSTIAIPLLMFSFFKGYSFFTGAVGSLAWYLLYYGSFMLLFAYSVINYYKKTTYEDRVSSKWMMRVFMVPTMIIFVYSVLIWIINFSPIPYITRGVSDTIFMVGAYFSGITLAKILGNRVFKIGLYSAFLTIVASIFLGIVNLRGAFFQKLLDGTNPYVELSEVLFTLGLYILCVLFTKNRFKEKNINVLIFFALVFFIIGNKRIGLAGVLLTFLYTLLGLKQTTKVKRSFIRIAGYSILIFGLVYVNLCISSEFYILIKSLGIEVMGRDILYNYFRQFGEFKLSFLGHGVGFVGRTFSYTTSRELYNMAVTKALHNDYLKMFLEVGFVGFVTWLIYWLCYLPKILIRKIGIDYALICFALIIYSFITYATDNTMGYFNFQMHLSMILTAIASGSLKIDGDSNVRR